MAQVEYHPAPHKQSPYMWDFPDPITGTFPTYAYDKMDLYNKFHRANYIGIVIVGGSLSMTLFYLVVFETKGVFKPYIKMLLMCSMSDMFFWMFFTGFKGILIDGVYFLSINGAAKHFDREVQLMFLACYGFGICLIHTILPAQAYFRYHALKTSTFLSVKKTLFLFIFSVICTLPTAYFCRAGFDYSAEIWPNYNYALLWYKEFPVPVAHIANIRHFNVKMYFLQATILINLSFGIFIYILRLTMRELNQESNGGFKYSNKTRQLQKQLTRFLICQAMVTFCNSVIPVAAILIPLFMKIDAGATPSLCLFIVGWVPAVNPVLSNIIITPYRRFIIGCFKRLIGAVNSKVSRNSTDRNHSAMISNT
ncbi:unnamed protein product [Bursaphelenchus okinawaensis]|uniref:G_PROTEIN_RECEP_F1_2 domain-containing protein n=1 Tax=Bursaphelenchus okinawaensis TaxID=465554 RepID=A0A811KTY0_9BILA|nr:unnamed protein product [Bursaphelenchus okinawaensis]CAG9112105.1 unnamed protein product [Bursaphelenchus okinawaensis]